MISRVSLAAGLLLLFAPVLGAQPTAAWRPSLRAPHLTIDSASFSIARSSPTADGFAEPAPARLRFEPFKAERGSEDAFAFQASPQVRALPHCPMPVARVDSTEDPMPMAKADSTRHYSILVAPPQCIAEPAR
jgi:hypothetical protein